MEILTYFLFCVWRSEIYANIVLNVDFLKGAFECFLIFQAFLTSRIYTAFRCESEKI